MRTLKATRAAKKLTYRALSEMTGVHEVNLNRIELGRAVPNVTTRVKIEVALGEPINFLDGSLVDEKAILSEWYDVEALFRLMVQRVNGLVEPGERTEFINTALRYIRRMKKGE